MYFPVLCWVFTRKSQSKSWFISFLNEIFWPIAFSMSIAYGMATVLLCSLPSVGYHSLVFKAFNSYIQRMFLNIFNILNAKCFCSKSWYSVSGDRWSCHVFLLSWINACINWHPWRLKCLSYRKELQLKRDSQGLLLLCNTNTYQKICPCPCPLLFSVF